MTSEIETKIRKIWADRWDSISGREAQGEILRYVWVRIERKKGGRVDIQLELYGFIPQMSREDATKVIKAGYDAVGSPYTQMNYSVNDYYASVYRWEMFVSDVEEVPDLVIAVITSAMRELENHDVPQHLYARV